MKTFFEISGLLAWVWIIIRVIFLNIPPKKQENKKEGVFEANNWCDICANETTQIFHNGGNDNNVSNDWRICKRCGSRYSELTKEWDKLHDNDGY